MLSIVWVKLDNACKSEGIRHVHRGSTKGEMVWFPVLVNEL